MKYTKIQGIKRVVRLIEWADVEDMVERNIRRRRKFFDKLAQM